MKFIKTIDGSNTLYSKQYDQNFHSVVDGALEESLSKHILPAFNLLNTNEQLNILDICFGIGYNTLATIYHCKKNNIKNKINFYSPEFDEELITSLKDFSYPIEFNYLQNIINEISINKFYQDEQFEINIYIGDAREYIKTLSNIDIVYQDAFSSEVNKELWTKEYFTDIAKLLNDKSIITTYSIATPVRLSMWENGIYIYEHILKNKRKATIGLNYKITNDKLKFIDMDKKLLNNPSAKALYD